MLTGQGLWLRQTVALAGRDLELARSQLRMLAQLLAIRACLDIPSAPMMARRALELLAEPIAVAGRNVGAAASIGIAVFPDDADNPSELLKAADAAMCAAKGLGRRRIALPSPELPRRAADRFRLEQELRQALRRDEREIYDQAQVAMASRRVVGVEALPRSNLSARGLLPAADFIRVAEDSGPIHEIGRWVLRRAVEQVGLGLSAVCRSCAWR